MKKLINIAVFTLVALFSTSSFAKWHGCQEQNLVFFSYNMKHTKAVEVCQSMEGYSYTYGPIGKPEIVLDLDPSHVEFNLSAKGDTSVIFTNGKYTYWVTEATMGQSGIDVTEKIKAYPGSKSIAFIELDVVDKNFVNNISAYNH
ncbi:hypothetical protein DP806_10810 [Salmonella enterica subsp. enterica serovar Saintpaul]|nr:hypothetical protein [Salmonella enterica subsp. enterica serovar Saintpaul]MEK75900.1 hypothetical protein [Salmonella enterica]